MKAARMRPPIRLSAAALLLAAAPLAAQEAPPEVAPGPTVEPTVGAPAKAPEPAPAPQKATAPRAPAARSAATPTTVEGTTRRTGAAAVPLNERVAVIGVLDKRLGSTGEFTLKPGENFRFGQISGVLRSCETTQPFERKQSAAFVQVAETPRTVGNAKPAGPKLVFSGWLFAESPSLNPFVHPVYDVWLKSCTMRFPDGPKPPSSSTGNRTSGARKSGAAKPAAEPAAPAATPAPPSQD